jgi:hypothetical protein
LKIVTDTTTGVAIDADENAMDAVLRRDVKTVVDDEPLKDDPLKEEEGRFEDVS